RRTSRRSRPCDRRAAAAQPRLSGRGIAASWACGPIVLLDSYGKTRAPVAAASVRPGRIGLRWNRAILRDTPAGAIAKRARSRPCRVRPAVILLQPASLSALPRQGGAVLAFLGRHVAQALAQSCRIVHQR